MSEVTVVVPTWRRAPWLARCLTAVLAQEVQPREVLVVGRQEDHDSQRVVEELAITARVPLRWVEVDRPGHIAPIEAGLRATATPYVAFVDDDAEPLAGWLAALMEPFRDPRVACVGGRVDTPSAETPVLVARDAGKIRWYGRYVGGVGVRRDPVPVDVHGLVECNWAWRTNVLSKLHFVRLFDADDGLHYGLDLCLQALAQGYRVVYTSRAAVVHYQAPRPFMGRLEDAVTRAFVAGRNMTFIGLARYKSVRRAFFLAWWVGVGERQSYGFAKAVWDLLRTPREAWPRVQMSIKGRVVGITAWWILRRALK